MNYNKTPKEIYKNLTLGNEITDIYKKVEEHENIDGRWGYHNYTHVTNVTKNAEKILVDLGLDEDTIYACKIACLLHDVGALEGKDEHAERSYEYAKKLFKEHNWNFIHKNEVLEAIRIHSDGFETDNLIALSLILADKIEIQKDRFTEIGLQIIGHRQYGHIEDITINIKDNLVSIHFVSDGNIDIKEANSFYFTPKIFKAVEAFSNKMHLNYEILMDDKIWSLT